MNKKTKYLGYFLTLLIVCFILNIAYIQNRYKLTNSMSNIKNKYVQFVALPDLAISTEAMYIRYRSLSNSFEIFKDDPSIYTYFPSTFTISHSGLQNNISRIKSD